MSFEEGDNRAKPMFMGVPGFAETRYVLGCSSNLHKA
jgi:hypothetical protein